MIQVHEIAANHALQAPLSFQDVDRQVVSEVLADSKKTALTKLHSYLYGVLKQFGKLDSVSLEIAKSLLTYSWIQKQDDFIKSLESSLAVITSPDNPRWDTFKSGLARFPNMTSEQYRDYRKKFIGLEAMLVGSDLIDEIFKYEYKAGLRMYHATKQMRRHETYTNPLLHPPTHMQSAQAVREFYQLKQEELNAEHKILVGYRENIEKLAGANLTLWNQAFDNRTTQVQNDIEEVNKAFSDLTKAQI